MNRGRVIGALDGFQRRHRCVGFPLAVLYKFVDDQGSYLTALVTYYGFLSLFPLLLLLVTILGFALHGDPHLQARLLDSALSQFPVIGTQLRENVRASSGSGLGLAAGIAPARCTAPSARPRRRRTRSAGSGRSHATSVRIRSARACEASD